MQSSVNDPADPSPKKASSMLKQKHEPQHNISSSCSESESDSITSDNEIQLERTPSSFFVDSLSSVKKRDYPTTRQNNKSGKQRETNLDSKLRNDKKPQKVQYLRNTLHCPYIRTFQLALLQDSR